MLNKWVLLSAAVALSMLSAPAVMADDVGDNFNFENGGADVVIDSDIGELLAKEAMFSPPLAEWAGGEEKLEGNLAYVGRGCFSDPHLADPAGKIALIERGFCRFDEKVALAEAAGATGVIVFNLPGPGFPATTGNWRLLMGGNPVVGIPAVFVTRNDGIALMTAAGDVKIEYNVFSLLLEAVDAIPSTLSVGEKTSLKDKVGGAKSLTKGKNRDIDAARGQIFDFQTEVVDRFFEGKILIPGAQSLVDTSEFLIERLFNVPPDLDD
jgi:hypothetical protein